MDVKIPEGGEVESEESATAVGSAGNDEVWELHEEIVGHAKPAEAASRLFSMGQAAITGEREDRAKAIEGEEYHMYEHGIKHGATEVIRKMWFRRSRK